MATISNLNANSPHTHSHIHSHRTTFMLIIVVMLWVPSATSIAFYTPDNTCNVYQYEKPRNCTYGSYKINTNPFCPDREICFLGLGEPCKQDILEARCARGLACMCGRCMNCMGGLCNMELCQKRIEVPKRWMSPYERNPMNWFNRPETEYY